MKIEVNMSLSYPELQKFFICCYNKKDIPSFTTQLMENLTKDKESRKQRFVTYTKEEFFMTSSKIDNISLVYFVVGKLFSLKPNDPEFIEKSYFLLDELTSYAKKEGNEEVLDYLKMGISVGQFRDAHSGRMIMEKATMIANTHQEHSFDFNGPYKERFNQISEYCQTYRKDSILLYKELLEKS